MFVAVKLRGHYYEKTKTVTGTTRYVRFEGDAVATIGCLDQDQDDDDRYEAGPHNFPGPPLPVTLVGPLLGRRDKGLCSREDTINKTEARVSHQGCPRQSSWSTSSCTVRAHLTLWRLTRRGLCAFRAYRFSNQACARRDESNVARLSGWNRIVCPSIVRSRLSGKKLVIVLVTLSRVQFASVYMLVARDRLDRRRA